MRQWKRAAAALALALLPALTGCGLAGTVSAPYNGGVEMTSPDNGTVENARFRMDWDDEYKRVRLTEKASGLVWSTTPSGALTPRVDEDGMPLPVHPQLNSPIVVEYIEPVTFELKTASAYVEAIMGGTVAAQAVENGFRATYYFEDLHIAVPVEYTLRDEGLAMTVDAGAIEEEENKVSRVIFAPFMCAADHRGDGGYVLVPSGSGALIEARDRGDTPLVYSQEVYGDDANRYKLYRQDITNSEAIRLPVFGARDGETALCGIIENGAEAASIEVSAGSKTIGFTGVTASFAVRGYQWIRVTGKGEFNRKYADSKTQERFTVAYYPLTGEQANYNGMAQVYRRFLWGNDLPVSAGEPVLALQLLGGVMVKESMLGIPYNAFFPLTTTAQAGDIIREITGETGYTPAVDLLGFGKTGLDTGEIGGGFTAAGKLGGKKGMQALAADCAQNGTPLYMDFDLVRFSQSGQGVSSFTGKALDIHGQSTAQYQYSMWSRSRLQSAGKSFLLARSQLAAVSERAADAAGDLGLRGIGLHSLSTVCYSDYADAARFVKAGTAKETAAVIEDYRQRGLQTAVNGGNAYAAAGAAMIFDTPLQSAMYDLFDETIPFYALVFKGHIPMASTAINLAVNPQEALLRSVETGIGLSFTLAAEYSTTLLESAQKGLYGVAYDGVRETLLRCMKEHGAYLESVRGAAVTDHRILENGLRRTVFSNGVTVYVNHTQKELTAGGVTVPAESYQTRQGVDA